MKSKYLHYIYLLIALIPLACNKNSSQHRLIPLEDFFKSAEKSNMLLSPNGKYVSFIALYKNRPNVFLQDLGTQEILKITNDTLIGINKYMWLNDSLLIYLKDIDGKSNYHLFKKCINKLEKEIDLTPFEGVKIQITSNNIYSNSDIFIQMNKLNPNVLDLFKINVVTNKISLIEKNPGNIGSWLEDLNGEVRLRVETDGVNEKIFYKRSSSSEYKLVHSLNFKETLLPLAFTKEGSSIYALSNINRDKIALVVFDLESAKEKQVIFEHDAVDVSDIKFSEITNSPIYAAYHTSKYQIRALNTKLDTLINFLKNRISDESFLILNSTKNEQKFLIKSYSDRSLGEYYIFDYSTNALNKIASTKNWIDKDILAEQRTISYVSRDSLYINAYLTLPKTKQDKYPLIVWIGYNPWERIKWQYNSEVQFLANRGYAVLQVNHRGVGGYGKYFQQKGFQEIGRKMQDDIDDGVRFLIRQGIVDSTRIGTMGYSLGGFAALNACVRDSNLYKCAVSYSGYLNLFSYVKTIPPYYHQYLEMIYEMLGNPEKDSEYFKSVSPIFNSEKIKASVFIAHGQNDNRVSTDEVNRFVKSLQKQNQHVQYLYITGEGHGFRKLENKYTLYHEIEKFLETKLKTINE